MTITTSGNLVEVIDDGPSPFGFGDIAMLPQEGRFAHGLGVSLTSGGGRWALLKRGVFGHVFVLVGPARNFALVSDATNSGVSHGIPEDDIPGTRASILELHRRSGLTWQELAQVFGVDRRSLHLWARGARPSPFNARRLAQVLELIQGIDASAEETRTRIYERQTNGQSIYDTLVRNAIADAQVPKNLEPRSGLRGKQGRSERGTHVTELLGALHGTVHEDQGKLLNARPLRPRAK